MGIPPIGGGGIPSFNFDDGNRSNSLNFIQQLVQFTGECSPSDLADKENIEKLDSCLPQLQQICTPEEFHSLRYAIKELQTIVGRQHPNSCASEIHHALLSAYERIEKS